MPFAPAEKAEIYYESHGKGPVLVFAHGAGGNAASWFNQVPFFMDRYRVLTFDHRGFGRSRSAAEDFDVRYFADDIAAVLDHAGIDRAAIVGQSMGGWTALRAALGMPARIRALVLTNTSAGIDLSSALESIRTIPERVVPHALGHPALAQDLPARDPVRAFLYGQIARFNPDLGDRVGRMLTDRSRNVAPRELLQLDLPVLVVTSPYDIIFPPSVAREVAVLIPGARLAEVPRAGHSAYFEMPSAFNDVLARFLARAYPGGEG